MIHLSLTHSLGVLAFTILGAISYGYIWFWHFISFFESTPASVFDFIVVGAGSAGAVVASRLSENEKYSVLLIEAGAYPIGLMEIPLISSIWTSTPFAWNYQTEPQSFGFEGSSFKKCNWPKGKTVGGSSLLNFMLYVRGSKYDYDQWAALGNKGWSYPEVLPFFMMSENNTGINIEEEFHGKQGPVVVEDRAWRSNLPQAFIDAGLQLGFSHVDINGANQTGFTLPQVTMKNGARWSAFSAFIKNFKKRSNLKVMTFAQVEKVLIDKSKFAYGVQYRRHGHLYSVYASKEIILSAGAVGSPQILMLSGIGPKEHLEQFGIEVLSDRKVGENLQDHVYVPLAPLIHNDSSASLVSPLDLVSLWNYAAYGKGQYSSNGVDGMAFKSSKYCEQADWPDIQLHFLSYSPASDHGICLRNLLGYEGKLWKELFEPVSSTDTASIFATLVRPKSKGWIRLKSTNPSDFPVINPQYFSHPQDAKVMLEGENVANTTSMKNHMFLYNLNNPYCKNFPINSDSYFKCLIKHMAATLHHAVGTCKMGPSTDDEAVVDSQLRVYGIEGLRVVDASIMPIIPNGNINAPVIMIGEKAARMILDYHSSKYNAFQEPSKSNLDELPKVIRNEL